VIEFVFMRTRDDVTVGDAPDVLASIRESGRRHVGFKDIGPPPETLAEDELRSLRAAHRHDKGSDPVRFAGAMS
jgi:hypothetical protein